MSSLPDGVTVRPATKADAEAAAAVMRADEEASLGHSRIGAADILEFWRRSDLEHDSCIIEQGRRVVAFGWVHLHGEVAEAAGAVHPDAHGRGLGALVVERSERRAVEHGRARIHQWAVAADPRAHELFEGRGYSEVRRFYEMAIELDEPPPEPELPAGLAIETFHEEEARAFHAATVEAFGEEWGFQRMPFDEWWEMRSQADDFDPSLWFVVRDGKEIAAVIRGEANRREGAWIGMLGVRKPWRRRGLGLALLRHTFREFHRRGERRIGLGVDSENPTGATRLYERAGMQVDAAYITYAKELRPG